MKELLPKFIEIENYSLKSKYTKKYLEDSTETKKMLNHLLSCINMNLDDLLKYWTISADKLNFSEEFNEKLRELINEFNKFYRIKFINK